MKSTVERRWRAHGLECAVIFVYGSHRCGYVRVPEGHPFFGRDLPEDIVDVHGGVTFGGGPIQLLGEGYWLGFDCAHAGDHIGARLGPPAPGEHFWTEAEVVAETEHMAEQIAAAA